jgi:uracil-DNA glycosylase
MSKRIKPSGPINASIAIVGDFPHQQDELVGLPFMSSGGQELTRMLADAGINRADCYLTTVFKTRPFKNDIKTYCAPKKEVGGKDYTLPSIASGKYIKPEFLFELSVLREELESVRPNIIIALGNVATWALMQQTAITKIRGAIAESTLLPGIKVLPTYHPAAVLRQWANRPIVLLDLMKAEKESKFPEIIRPQREIWIRPKLEDLQKFFDLYCQDIDEMTMDIETESKQITCFGFAPDKSHALVIPFVDKEQPGFSYWRTPADEIVAWNFVKMICTSTIGKIGQNGLYDIQYLLRVNGIPMLNYSNDTMLMFHALYSELPKGLGFLGSVFTNEASWKGMHKVKSKELDTVKKDD